MPAVPITDMKQYQKAIEVLTRVGGTYQGVGHDDWYLLVTLAQYDALVEAGVVNPANTNKDNGIGAKPKKKRHTRRDA